MPAKKKRKGNPVSAAEMEVLNQGLKSVEELSVRVAAIDKEQVSRVLTQSTESLLHSVVDFADKISAFARHLLELSNAVKEPRVDKGKSQLQVDQGKSQVQVDKGKSQVQVNKALELESIMAEILGPRICIEFNEPKGCSRKQGKCRRRHACLGCGEETHGRTECTAWRK